MTLSKRQYGYLNQQVTLFRLQYETHSLQMHPKSSCRSVVALTPKSSERRYALRLVVVPCQYFPILSPLFQPISPSTLSHIYYVAAPHLLFRRINTCYPASPPLCSSAAVFTDDLVCHTLNYVATIRPQVGSFSLSIFSQSVAVLPSHLPSTLSRISSVAVPHLLRRHIHPCFPASTPPCLSAVVFTTDLVCHTYYPESPPHLPCYPPVYLLRFLSHYLPLFRVLYCLFYLLRLDLTLALRYSVIHCLLRSAPNYFSKYPL